MKDNKIILRIDKKFSDEYFKICNDEGYTMSKRVRRILELDVELFKLNINTIKELEKIINNDEKTV